MINVHSHTRTLETLKPYQATTRLDHDLGVLTLGREHLVPHLTVTTTNAPTYLMYPMNRNFMEYLVTLVVTFTW